jgi:hypothetical protein
MNRAPGEPRGRRRPAPLETPDTDAAWSGLSGEALAGIAECDARRLTLERSRVAPHIREKITEPLYSVRNLFAFWERLVRRMESGWQLPGQYPISAYSNDLDARDHLQHAVQSLPAPARTPLEELLARLDERFLAQTVPDDAGELRPWVRPSAAATDEPGEHWRRKPVINPW